MGRMPVLPDDHDGRMQHPGEPAALLRPRTQVWSVRDPEQGAVSRARVSQGDLSPEPAPHHEVSIFILLIFLEFFF